MQLLGNFQNNVNIFAKGFNAEVTIGCLEALLKLPSQQCCKKDELSCEHLLRGNSVVGEERRKYFKRIEVIPIKHWQAISKWEVSAANLLKHPAVFGWILKFRF